MKRAPKTHAFATRTKKGQKEAKTAAQAKLEAAFYVALVAVILWNWVR